jgi:hypothetical protein
MYVNHGIASKTWRQTLEGFLACLGRPVLSAPVRLSGPRGPDCTIRLCCFSTRLPDFSRSKLTKLGKIYQMTTNYIYQKAVNWTKWPWKYSKWSWNIPTSSIPRPSKIYPKWYFLLENKPSGNPASQCIIRGSVQKVCETTRLDLGLVTTWNLDCQIFVFLYIHT